MSDSQAYEEITIASDGVTVVKRFEEDEFPVPAIAFEFSSNRDEAVTVRLSDTVPDGIEVEDLGFHPEYGSEYWTVDEETISFERELEANSSYTTVYGIRATGSDNVEQFLTEPTLEEVDPPLPEDEAAGEEIIPESGDDVVKDAIAGDGEIPGLEEDEEESGDEDVDTLDLADPNQPGQEASTDESTGETAEPSDANIEADSLVTALATEIRQQNVSAEDVKLLRRAFEMAREDGGSTAAKIQQIQTDISDLRAYTNSLEEFLDENGTGEEIIEGFEERLDSFDSKLEEFATKLDENSNDLEAIGGEMDSLREEFAEVSEDVGSIGDEMSEVSEEVASFDDRLEQLDGSIDDVEDEIERLESEITDDDVVERIDEIEEDISDLREWQEQIKQTFGG